MSQRAQTNGTGRLAAARHTIEREVERVGKQIRARTRGIEKTLEKNRKQIETRGRKQIKSLMTDVRKTSAFKRATSLRKDAEHRIESGVETLLSTLQIASKSDVARIDRRLRNLNKKLNEIEKASAEDEESTAASA